MNEQLEFLKEIAARLQAADIPYMLTGSMALAVYALPRMTRDLDMVIALGLEDVEKFVKLFEKDCYVHPEAVRQAIKSKGTFNIIHNDWIIKADFIIRKEVPYRKIEFERRRKLDVSGVSIDVVTPEDLLLSKLHWIKQSESELQRRDVLDIIRSVEDLDWLYLEEWAGKLSVGALLEKMRMT